MKCINIRGYNIPLERDNEVFMMVNKLEGYELVSDDYYISNCGRVLSLKYWHGEPLRIRKHTIANEGYPQVYLMYESDVLDEKGRDVKTGIIARMVAQAFVHNPYVDVPLEELEVHHKDKDNQNNYFENLQWVLEEEHDEIDMENIVYLHDRKTFEPLYIGSICKFADLLGVNSGRIYGIVKGEPLATDSKGDYRIYAIDSNFTNDDEDELDQGYLFFGILNKTFENKSPKRIYKPKNIGA
jgi:hypothetical protein